MYLHKIETLSARERVTIQAVQQLAGELLSKLVLHSSADMQCNRAITPGTGETRFMGKNSANNFRARLYQTVFLVFAVSIAVSYARCSSQPSMEPAAFFKNLI